MKLLVTDGKCLIYIFLCTFLVFNGVKMPTIPNPGLLLSLFIKVPAT